MKSNIFTTVLVPSTLLLIFSLGATLPARVDQTSTDQDPVLAQVQFEDLSALNELARHVDIWEVDQIQKTALVYVSPLQMQALSGAGFQVEIDRELTADIHQDREPVAGQDSGIPGFPCYRTVEETYASLANLSAAHPQLAEWIDIGNSWEKLTSGGSRGYDLFTLVLTNKSSPGPKPRLFLMAAIHAREYATAELAARFAEFLVEEYDHDPDITWLLDYNEVHILPTANPDGRKIAEGGVYWRKNTNSSDGCSNSNLWGTDLNRNSSFKWGAVGASQDACDETFRGSAPASEPETLALQNYLSAIYADQRGPADSDPAPDDLSGLLITLHSYGDLIIYPWGWTADPAPNQMQLQSLGRKFGFYTGYPVCQSGEAGCMYQTSGSTDDWVYGELGVPGYTFELGHSFFESCTYFDEQLLPQQLPALVYALKASRSPYQNPAGPESVDLVLSAERITPGAGLVLSFTADDGRFSKSAWGEEPSQAIAAARYSFSTPSWVEGTQTIPLQPEDGSFDSAHETFSTAINTSGLEFGRQTIFIESRDADGNWGVPSAVFFWVSPAEYQPDLSPDSSYGAASPGSKIKYQIQLVNAGTQDDSFDLQILGNRWPAAISTPVVSTLIPGDSTTFTVEVTVPANVTPGALDQVTLLATSHGDSRQFTHARITTMTGPPRLFLPNVTR